MTAPASAPTDVSTLLRHPPDFSLVLGGPPFQLLRRAHLADDALMLVHQRVLVIALVAWLPLLLLSALEGRLLGGGVAVPFLLDLDVHIRDDGDVVREIFADGLGVTIGRYLTCGRGARHGSSFHNNFS